MKRIVASLAAALGLLLVAAALWMKLAPTAAVAETLLAFVSSIRN